MGCRSWKAWGPTAGLDCKWKGESLEGFELTALFRPSFNRAAWLPGGEQTEAAAGAGARPARSGCNNLGRDAGGLGVGRHGQPGMYFEGRKSEIS